MSSVRYLRDPRTGRVMERHASGGREYAHQSVLNVLRSRVERDGNAWGSYEIVDHMVWEPAPSVHPCQRLTGPGMSGPVRA